MVSKLVKRKFSEVREEKLAQETATFREYRGRSPWTSRVLLNVLRVFKVGKKKLLPWVLPQMPLPELLGTLVVCSLAWKGRMQLTGRVLSAWVLPSWCLQPSASSRQLLAGIYAECTGAGHGMSGKHSALFFLGASVQGTLAKCFARL